MFRPFCIFRGQRWCWNSVLDACLFLACIWWTQRGAEFYINDSRNFIFLIHWGGQQQLKTYTWTNPPLSGVFHFITLIYYPIKLSITQSGEGKGGPTSTSIYLKCTSPGEFLHTRLSQLKQQNTITENTQHNIQKYTHVHKHSHTHSAHTWARSLRGINKKQGSYSVNWPVTINYTLLLSIVGKTHFKELDLGMKLSKTEIISVLDYLLQRPDLNTRQVRHFERQARPGTSVLAS